MSESPPKVRVRIGSARDLARAVRSPDASLVGAVLSMIERHPSAAKAFGPYGSRDVVDEVIGVSQRLTGQPLDRIVASALVALDDPRAREELMRRWPTLTDASTLAIVAGGLSVQDCGRARTFLARWLMQNGSRPHARGVATAWSDRADLDEIERVRRAVAQAGGADVPLCDEGRASEAWIAELHGPFAGEARSLLELQGVDALRRLRSLRSELDADSSAWLLTWGLSTEPLEVMELARDALHNGEQVEVVLRGLSGSDEGIRRLFRPLVTRYSEHEDPRMRRWAVVAGASTEDVARSFEKEDDPVVRAAWIRRVAAEQGSDAVLFIADALEDSHWRVRSTASRALRAMGPDVGPSVRKRMASSDPGARAAAAQVLLNVGDEEWMEEMIIT